MKKRRWILVGCSLLLLCLVFLIPFNRFFKEEGSSPQAENILAHLRKVSEGNGRINFLIIGDSVALGKGAEKTGAGYGSYIVQELEQEQLNVTLDNQARSGQTSADLLKSLQRREMEKKIKNADLITITVGGNDLLKHALDRKNRLSVLTEFATIQAQYKENMATILERLRHLNQTAPILITALYNPISVEEPYYPLTEKLLEKWNAGLKEVAYGFSEAVVIEVTSHLHQAKENWLADEIHPNDQGYRLIAKGIMERIRQQEDR